MEFFDKKMYIVGSGPGDPELLTVKAYRILEKAQVILFDNLINTELLNLAPKNCIKEYVGKCPYGKYVPQEDINKRILYFCAKYDRVVRLKGGDPYLFGRGYEEWAEAINSGIHVEYVPGISSMQGAGVNAIPLTHRGVSDGVWAITGTKTDGSFSSDLALAVQCKSTVVIYMGMRKLHEIARMYVWSEKGGTPVAVIQHATLPQQRIAIGEVKDLVKMCAAENIGHPAIIVIGPVVNLQYVLTGMLAKRHVV